MSLRYANAAPFDAHTILRAAELRPDLLVRVLDCATQRLLYLAQGVRECVSSALANDEE